MHVYDFISKKITEQQVKEIVSTAGYNPVDYKYEPRVNHDGYVVSGEIVMSLTLLRNAAKELHIPVEITSALAAAESAAALAAFATDYSVDITMSPKTVQTLLASNYYLYGFKAVQASIGGGAPLVWFQSQNFSTDTLVSWQTQYQAYTSNSQIIPNGQITAGFSADIDLAQTLEVGAGGIGHVVNGGTPHAISILNQTQKQFTCGISEVQDGQSAPMCAFPLYGNNLDVIVPIAKVLLMFSTLPVNTGTVIEQSYGPGLLIDLTASQHRSVNYDINLGWSWGGFSWAQQVQANANLVPLLIETGTVATPRQLSAGVAAAVLA